MPKLSVLATPASGGRAEDIVARLREAVFLGILNPGDQLPTEIDLAQQFGVAPMTVRDALAVLRERGLIETRRGRTGGSFIRQGANLPVEEARSRLAELTLSQLRDLIDEQQAISGQSAALAAERASEVNVRRLFEFTDRLRAADDVGDCVRADSRFHVEVAVAAQSERLTRQEVRIQAEVSGLLWLPLGPELDRSAIADEHHAIAVAIATGDPDLARQKAQEHVRRSLHQLTELQLLVTEDES